MPLGAGHHRHTPIHGSTVSRPSSGPAWAVLRRPRRPPEGLGHGDGQEGAGDPPLVAVEPVEHDLERVLQRLAQEPEEGEPHEDAGGQHDAVGPGRHAPGPGQQAHQVAAHHQEHDRQAGPVGPALDPPDGGRRAARLAFEPAQTPVAVPGAEEEEHDRRGEEAKKLTTV
jgi:hypothetical protein